MESLRKIGALAGLLALLCLSLPATAARGAGANERQILESLDYRVRVRVISDARRIKLHPRGPFQLVNSAGREFYRSTKPRFIKCEVPRTETRPVSYRVVVARFKRGEKVKAELFARQVKARTHIDVNIIAVTDDFRRYRDFALFQDQDIVTVGHFYHRPAAESWARKLAPAYPQATVLRDPRPSSSGIIRITIDSGESLGNFKDRVELRLLSAEDTTDIEPLQSESSAWRRVKGDDRQMRGNFELWINTYGRLRMANELPIEEYLYSVAPKEIGSFSPIEALKAQAIAVRTTALHRISAGRNPEQRYDLTDQQMSMVYEGCKTETPETTKAIKQTRGIVMMHGGKLIDAVFSHSCGGVMAGGEEVWAGGGTSSYLSDFSPTIPRWPTSGRPASGSPAGRTCSAMRPRRASRATPSATSAGLGGCRRQRLPSASTGVMPWAGCATSMWSGARPAAASRP
ncbi:SpoIID/LytB domain-containing protein [Candidatus Sumerlaeota bacterium]